MRQFRPIAAISGFRRGNIIKSGKKPDDVRNACLPLPAGASAGAAEAVRDCHTEALGKARYPSGRLLHHAGRRIQPGAHLPAGLGVHGRAREEVGGVHGRSGMDQCAS